MCEPATPPAPCLRPICLRPARPDEAGLVLALEETTMRPVALALWGVWRPRPAAQLDLAACRIIEGAGQPVGVVEWHRSADELRIAKLYIQPESQRCGIGGWVLAQAAAQAQGLPIRLSVLTTNPALEFYRRHGFVIETSTAERHHLIRR